jgi:hypothetical protein
MYKRAAKTRRDHESVLLDQIDYGRKKSGEDLFKKKPEPAATDPYTPAVSNGQKALDAEPVLYCEFCGEEISKNTSISAKQYRSRKYCSRECFGLANTAADKKPEPEPEPEININEVVTWAGFEAGLRYCGLREDTIQSLRALFDAGRIVGTLEQK